MRTHSQIKKLQRTGVHQKLAKLQMQIVELPKAEGKTQVKAIAPTGVYKNISDVQYKKRFYNLLTLTMGVTQDFRTNGAKDQSPSSYGKAVLRTAPVIQSLYARKRAIEMFINLNFKQDYRANLS